MSLAEKQARLLGEREAALRSLGLGELAENVEQAAQAARAAHTSRAAAKRRVPGAALEAAAAAGTLRRSSR